MNALQQIGRAAKRLGYRADAIKENYGFQDFAPGAGAARVAAMAVFTQTPPSYRSAAFGVAAASEADAERVARDHRALGAPLFFVVEGGVVSLWQVRGVGPARLLERTALGDIDALFDQHQSEWAPASIHRAKAIGKFDPTYQLDFVDAGLLPAIEGQIHQKLDRLLREAIDSIKISGGPRGLDHRHAFQGVFRLLAAKILIDRNHATAKSWNSSSVASVLSGIGTYYSLSSEKQFSNHVNAKSFEAAWKILYNGISVSNISADDLAFVYENTLVTPETRKTFGTHSTPRQVAELIAARLRLWHPSSADLTIYEPFTGAGVLLVAALRQMREALPADWSESKKHQHLVARLRGSEIDAFACEVATLSLILADYPNTNGWKIENKDLFAGAELISELKAADVIICNPPFEIPSGAERSKSVLLTEAGGNKAEAVLKLALQSEPIALGFVLPQAFLVDKAYAWHRKQLESRFTDIELISLPDGIFRESQVESALLIAQSPGASGSKQVIRSTEVADQDRKLFLETGATSRVRSREQVVSKKCDGRLWLPRLTTLWQSLDDNPRLSAALSCHWGLRWKEGGQTKAAWQQPGPNREKGLLRSHDHRQFRVGEPLWLDINPKHQLYGALSFSWDKPKILCNAVRSSRGAWRISAAVDRTGLYASQQFAVLWPETADVDLDALAAIINGPLANAYLHDFSFDKRLRIQTFLNLPLPKTIPEELGDLSRQYTRHLADSRKTTLPEEMQRLLDSIDELVLDAYGLSPKQTRDLLAVFYDQERPVVHSWHSWNVRDTDAALTLSELRSDWVAKSRGPWPASELIPISGLTTDEVANLWGSDD